MKPYYIILRGIGRLIKPEDVEILSYLNESRALNIIRALAEAESEEELERVIKEKATEYNLNEQLFLEILEILVRNNIIHLNKPPINEFLKVVGDNIIVLSDPSFNIKEVYFISKKDINSIDYDNFLGSLNLDVLRLNTLSTFLYEYLSLRW